MSLMATGAILSGVGAIGNLAMGWNESNDAEEAMEDVERQLRKKREFARERWQHYRDTYGDLEQQVVADAEEGVTGDFQGVTDRAAADVEGQFDNEQERQRRDMERAGLDPSSGRYQSTDRRLGMQRATTSAAQQNQAREKERRWADEQTWNRRQQVNARGTSLMEGASQDLQQARQGLAGLFSKKQQQHQQRADAAFQEAGQLGAQSVMQGVQAFGQGGGGSTIGGNAPGAPEMDTGSGNVDLFPSDGQAYANRGFGMGGARRPSPGSFSMGAGQNGGLPGRRQFNSQFYKGAQ